MLRCPSGEGCVVEEDVGSDPSGYGCVAGSNEQSPRQDLSRPASSCKAAASRTAKMLPCRRTTGQSTVSHSFS